MLTKKGAVERMVKAGFDKEDAEFIYETWSLPECLDKLERLLERLEQEDRQLAKKGGDTIEKER